MRSAPEIDPAPTSDVFSRRQGEYAERLRGMDADKGDLLLPVARNAADDATRLGDYLDAKGNSVLTASVAALAVFAGIARIPGMAPPDGYGRACLLAGLVFLAMAGGFAIWTTWIRNDWFIAHPRSVFQPGIVGGTKRELLEHLILNYVDAFERNVSRSDGKAIFVSLAQASLALGVLFLAVGAFL